MKNKLRKTLSIAGLLNCTRKVFEKVADPKPKGTRGPKRSISFQDILMSGLAIFNLKFAALLQYDTQRRLQNIKRNLATLYGVLQAPSDTYLRERLDDLAPSEIRPAFNKIFSELQKGKVLEHFEYLDGHYLVSADGTGYYSSKEVSCENCCVKNHKDGSKTYYHQLFGAAIVHPEYPQVLPLAPEPIQKQDGSNKNDCERNAAKRLFSALRTEHPNMNFIIIEDGLSSNGPHIRLLQDLSMRYILGAKPGDHKFLMDWVNQSACQIYQETDFNGTLHQFRYINQVPLNDANFDLKVNFLEYIETTKTGKVQKFSWVTDIEINESNLFKIMRGARARWKIENETFNTLKNQGYEFEHNFGHGRKNLCMIFSMLMMLAFLIDQVQALSCSLFKKIKKNLKTNKLLWQWLRMGFFFSEWESWQSLYEELIRNTTVGYDTS